MSATLSVVRSPLEYGGLEFGGLVRLGEINIGAVRDMMHSDFRVHVSAPHHAAICSSVYVRNEYNEYVRMAWLYQPYFSKFVPACLAILLHIYGIQDFAVFHSIGLG